VRARLQQQLSEARASLQHDEHELQRVRTESSDVAARASKLRAEVSSLSSQFDFFQRNRRWVTDLCSVLTDASPSLSAAEDSLHDAWGDVLVDVAARRAADTLDEVHECEVRGDEARAVVGPVPAMPPHVVAADAARAPGMVLGPEARLLRRRHRSGRGGSLAAAADPMAVLSDQEQWEVEDAPPAARVGE
jgi:hypothetical protein